MNKELMIRKAYRAATANGASVISREAIVTGMAAYLERREAKVSMDDIKAYVEAQATDVAEATSDFGFQTWMMTV